ncbi:hypothetical protein THF1D04_20192 [Vibrio owensii]|uniref:Uncharacterized protein n=1 Tax=Vibrio owensii TaxID=696485 RepID=A0AAU9Q5H1_9VIBR|nr:hypothetical protein THF1D04_20192 [Vibrio owensii]
MMRVPFRPLPFYPTLPTSDLHVVLGQETLWDLLGSMNDSSEIVRF